MEANFSKKVDLLGLSYDEANAINKVLQRVNATCFNQPDEETSEWLSNDDFVCTLSNDERAALATFCISFTTGIDEYIQDCEKRVARLKQNQE